MLNNSPLLKPSILIINLDTKEVLRNILYLNNHLLSIDINEFTIRGFIIVVQGFEDSIRLFTELFRIIS